METTKITPQQQRNRTPRKQTKKCFNYPRKMVALELVSAVTVRSCGAKGGSTSIRYQHRHPSSLQKCVTVFGNSRTASTALGVCEFVEDDGGAFVVYYTFITTDNMRMQKIAFTGSGLAKCNPCDEIN